MTDLFLIHQLTARIEAIDINIEKLKAEKALLKMKIQNIYQRR